MPTSKKVSSLDNELAHAEALVSACIRCAEEMVSTSDSVQEADVARLLLDAVLATRCREALKAIARQVEAK